MYDDDKFSGILNTVYDWKQVLKNNKFSPVFIEKNINRFNLYDLIYTQKLTKNTIDLILEKINNDNPYLSEDEKEITEQFIYNFQTNN